MRKRICIYVGCVVCLILLALSSVYRHVGAMTSETLFELKTTEQSTLFMKGRSQNWGPESFAISEDKIYVLDSIGKQLIINKSNKTALYPIDMMKYPKDIFIYQDYIYILDAWVDTGAIYVFDLDMREVGKIDLPKEINTDAIGCFYVTKTGELALRGLENHFGYIIKDQSISRSDECVSLIRNDDKFVTVSYGDQKFVLPAVLHEDYITVLDIVGDVLYYNCCNIIPGDKLIGTNVIYAVNVAGDCLGKTLIVTDADSFLPNRNMVVYDNKMYLLTVNKDGITVSEAKME